jgi:toxin ParE1/3/4
MVFDIVLHPKAQADIEQALDYYSNINVKIASALYNDLQIAYSKLSSNPFYQIRYDHFRCLPLGQFPYMIHYRLNEEQYIVEILGIIHTSLNPEENWIKDSI